MSERFAEWFAITPLSFAAICAMLAATYFCRAGGFWLMQHVPLTARVRRGLAALPGSIVMATVVPLALRGGCLPRSESPAPFSPCSKHAMN